MQVLQVNITGKRLELRPLMAENLELARQWVNDPPTARGLLRVLPVSQPEQEKWFQAICGDPTRMVWAVFQGGDHIGTCGLYHLDLLHRKAEAWFLIGRAEARRKGLGREMAELLLAYAFNGLGLHKVYLHVGQDNLPAIKLYQALGFEIEGTLVDEYFLAGHFCDVLRMRLFAWQWRQTHQQD